jgi:hypothetical protein
MFIDSSENVSILFVRILQARHSVKVTTETRIQVSGLEVTVFRSNSDSLIKLRKGYTIETGMRKENYS